MKIGKRFRASVARRSRAAALPAISLQTRVGNALVSDAEPIDEVCTRRSLPGSLRGVEFDLAGDQNRAARFATDFIRRDSFRHCDCRPRSRLDRARTLAAAPSLRLFPPLLQRSAHVWAQLSSALLGQKICLLRTSRSVAGDDSDFRNVFCPLVFAGGTDALAATRRRAARARRGRTDLRSTPRAKRNSRVLGDRKSVV